MSLTRSYAASFFRGEDPDAVLTWADTSFSSGYVSVNVSYEQLVIRYHSNDHVSRVMKEVVISK